MKLSRVLLAVGLLAACAGRASASVNESNGTSCVLRTVTVQFVLYNVNYGVLTTQYFDVVLQTGEEIVLADTYDAGSQNWYYYNTTGVADSPDPDCAPGSTVTWEAFDEPQAWSYGTWSPDCSTKSSCEDVEQSRTNVRWHHTGERSNEGQVRAEDWYEETSVEYRTVPGCASPSWSSFEEVLEDWTETSATPDCGGYWEDESFTQSYTEERTVRRGQRDQCGHEASVTEDTESWTGTRSAAGCRSLNWHSFEEVLVGWHDVSASPPTSAYPMGTPFTQNYTQERTVCGGQRNDRGDESGVTTWTETRSGTRTATGTAADTQPPAAPTGLRASNIGSGSFTLLWNAATDNVGVTGYRVNLDGGSFTDVGNVTSYAYYGLASGSSHTVQVKARDAVGLWSDVASFGVTTAASTGGGTGAAQSVWMDVPDPGGSPDGILDEVIKAGTPEFNYAINSWYTTNTAYYDYPVNNYWVGWSLDIGGEIRSNFTLRWTPALPYPQFWTTYPTWFEVDFRIEGTPGSEYRIYRNSTGATVFDPTNPAWELIVGGGLNANPYYALWSTYDPTKMDNAAFVMVKKGLPLGSVRLSDSSGNVLVDNLAINATADLFIPDNGQVALAAFDTVGQAIGAAHAIAWKILDGLGNILRQGTGLNVDFDNLPIVQIAQIMVILDSSPAKSVNVRAIRIEADDGQIGITGDFVPALAASSRTRHFVTPKKSAEIPADFVMLKAVGLTEAQFQETYEWVGGEEVTGQPLKRKVSRSATSRTPVSIRLKNTTAATVADAIVWVVWCDNTLQTPASVTDPKVAAQPSETIVALPGEPFPGQEWILPASDARHFKFVIQPTSIVDVQSGDLPKLIGFAEQPFPGEAALQASQLKWDVSRRFSAIFSNPAPSSIVRSQLWATGGEMSEAFDLLAATMPRSTPAVVVEFPVNNVAGNDDSHNIDEDNNPYEGGTKISPTSPFAAAPLGAVASSDRPRIPAILRAAGQQDETTSITIRFNEFVRLEIGVGESAKWYRISDDAPWTYLARFKRESAGMVDDGSQTFSGH